MHIYPKQVDSQSCQQDHIYEQCYEQVIHTFMNKSVLKLFSPMKNILLKLFSIGLDSTMYKI